jgi:hypothetical protein
MAGYWPGNALFSVNALVVIGQEPSVHAGLHVADLQLNYTRQTPAQLANDFLHALLLVQVVGKVSLLPAV